MEVRLISVNGLRCAECGVNDTIWELKFDESKKQLKYGRLELCERHIIEMALLILIEKFQPK